MKHKVSKRSSSNKQHHNRSYQTQTRRLSVQIDHTRTISPNHIDLGNGTVHFDSHSSCLKPNVLLKSQKLLKRDLIRCSNQRPSFLGPQTLQPPRIHHNSRQTHSIVSSSSSTSSSTERHHHRRRSLSVNSQTFYATIDRIGPWPDISINRLRSDGNDLLRPLKNFRNIKNRRLFSPKYYAGLNDNTSKFKFHPSQRTYMEEYRKQKGYLLIPQQPNPLTSLSSRRSDDDQLSAMGTFSSGGGGNSTIGERTNLSITNLSMSTRGLSKSADDLIDHNRVQIISSVTNQTNMFPSIPVRHNNIRTYRHSQQQQQPLTLPSLPSSSFRYINSMNSVDKTYNNNNKKSSKENQSKLYFLDGRQKKRLLHQVKTDSEVTTCSQDHLGLRITSSPVTTTSERPTVIIMYQLPRRTHNAIESSV